MNFVFFGVKKSGIGVFLVSVENGAGVKKMTNFRYDLMVFHCIQGNCMGSEKGFKDHV